MIAQILLIGVSGKPRAGKDTVTALLAEAFPEMYRTNFSQAIAEEYDAVHGTNTRHNEEEKVLHRPGFSELGHRRRLENPLYWVERTLIHEGPLLVAGVRHIAEAEAIRERGGILIRVEASEEALRARMGADYDSHMSHVVEKHLDDYAHWDFVIHNNGTLEELEEQVEKVIEKIKKKSA